MNRRSALKTIAVLGGSAMAAVAPGSVGAKADDGDGKKTNPETGDFVLFNLTLAGQDGATMSGFVARSLTQDELDFYHLTGPAWTTPDHHVIQPAGILSIVRSGFVAAPDLSALLIPPLGRLF